MRHQIRSGSSSSSSSSVSGGVTGPATSGGSSSSMFSAAALARAGESALPPLLPAPVSSSSRAPPVSGGSSGTPHSVIRTMRQKTLAAAAAVETKRSFASPATSALLAALSVKQPSDGKNAGAIIGKICEAMGEVIKELRGDDQTSPEEDLSSCTDITTLQRRLAVSQRGNKLMSIQLDLLDLQKKLEVDEARSIEERKTWAEVVREELYKEIVELLEAEFSCSVCNEVFILPTVTRCGHTFCELCIATWTKDKIDCPICRTAIFQEWEKHVEMDNFISRLHLRLSDEIRNNRDQLVEERKRAMEELRESGQSRRPISASSTGRSAAESAASLVQTLRLVRENSRQLARDREILGNRYAFRDRPIRPFPVSASLRAMDFNVEEETEENASGDLPRGLEEDGPSSRLRARLGRSGCGLPIVPRPPVLALTDSQATLRRRSPIHYHDSTLAYLAAGEPIARRPLSMDDIDVSPTRSSSGTYLHRNRDGGRAMHTGGSGGTLTRIRLAPGGSVSFAVMPRSSSGAEVSSSANVYSDSETGSTPEPHLSRRIASTALDVELADGSLVPPPPTFRTTLESSTDDGLNIRSAIDEETAHHEEYPLNNLASNRNPEELLSPSRPDPTNGEGTEYSNAMRTVRSIFSTLDTLPHIGPVDSSAETSVDLTPSTSANTYGGYPTDVAPSAPFEEPESLIEPPYRSTGFGCGTGNADRLLRHQLPLSTRLSRRLRLMDSANQTGGDGDTGLHANRHHHHHDHHDHGRLSIPRLGANFSEESIRPVVRARRLASSMDRYCRPLPRLRLGRLLLPDLDVDMRETPRPSAPVMSENSTTIDSLLNLSASAASTVTNESPFPLASAGLQEREINTSESQSGNANSSVNQLQLPSSNGESSSPWRPGGAHIYVRAAGPHPLSTGIRNENNNSIASSNGICEITTAAAVSGCEEATSGSETSQPPIMMDCDAEGGIPDVIDLTEIEAGTSSENADSSVNSVRSARRHSPGNDSDNELYHRTYFGIPSSPDE